MKTENRDSFEPEASNQSDPEGAGKCKLKMDLQAFAFGTPVTPRRSLRTKPESSGKIVPVPTGNATRKTLAQKRKRSTSLSNSDEEQGEKRKKKKPLKRGYAPPETYAHLNSLTDCLKEGVDVLFCGINPGCMSATKGCHFASPTNHFWRCLHRSGLTSRLLSPSEDHTLPDAFNIGLTNLVERPSAEAAELSKKEMAESVPTLFRKIVGVRPRVVCFVGKSIWDAFEARVKKDSGGLKKSKTELDSTKFGGPAPSKPTKGRQKPVTKWGSQPYKLVYDSERAELTADAQDERIAETLFFLVPSTSGRVVSHQLSDKVELFTELKSQVDQVKMMKFDPGETLPISSSLYQD
ncbi:hypothetical protein BOTBODRAFT_36223 [Botryobasidium botryosum FD-172 SS1]|uniref:Uracil-DNA glycosylase-like domain-containing protein n=1 Tax=Botryobasidium botryosum (strain FD-172 SS1) TaxID=930990 RepID=A0A067MF73_BOTB1|nr:hypothetical protein BOTBODRAFT_36223 [Botryobasidium botryosum FD-172 SS1]